jgi:ferredoxin
VPKITVVGDNVGGEQTVDAPEGKKLVLALEDGGIPVLHRCGGVPACTTCRVEVVSGDVPPMGDAEKEALEEPDLIAKYRLSCQIRVANDLTVHVAETLPEFRQRLGDPNIGPGDRPEE